MKIQRIVRKAEDGSYEATLALTEDQTAFLVQVAIGILMHQGTVTFFDVKQNEDGTVEETDQEAAAKDFLGSMDIEDMGKA